MTSAGDVASLFVRGAGGLVTTPIPAPSSHGRPLRVPAEETNEPPQEVTRKPSASRLFYGMASCALYMRGHLDRCAVSNDVSRENEEEEG